MVMAAAISADGMWITPQLWAEPPPPPALSDAEVLATFFGEQSLGLYAMPAPDAAATASQAEAANACLGSGLDFFSRGNEVAATLTDAEITNRYLGNAIDHDFATALAEDIATVDECFRPEDVHAMGPAVDYDDHFGPMPTVLTVMYHGGAAARPDIEEQRRMTASTIASDLALTIHNGVDDSPTANAGIARVVAQVITADPTALADVLDAVNMHADKEARREGAYHGAPGIDLGRDWWAPVLKGMADGVGSLALACASNLNNDQIRRTFEKGMEAFSSALAMAGRPLPSDSMTLKLAEFGPGATQAARNAYQSRVDGRLREAVRTLAEGLDKVESAHAFGGNGSQVKALVRDATQTLVERIVHHGKKHDSLGAVIDGLMAGAGPRWAPAARAALAEVSPFDIRRVDEAVNRRFQAQGRAEGVAFPDRSATPTGPTR